MTTPSRIGKFAEVPKSRTPALPVGTEEWFMVESDDHGRPVVRLSYFCSKWNRNLAEYCGLASTSSPSTPSKGERVLNPGAKTTAGNPELSEPGSRS